MMIKRVIIYAIIFGLMSCIADSPESDSELDDQKVLDDNLFTIINNSITKELLIQEKLAERSQERINKRKEEGEDVTEDQESLDKRVESLVRQRRILEEGDTETAS